MRKTCSPAALIPLLLALFLVVPAQANTPNTINPTWRVTWYEVVSPRVFGRELGTSSFPLNFSRNWGYGNIFRQHQDHIGFKATLSFYVPQPKDFHFEIAADDGAALYIDGKLVISDLWSLYTFIRGHTKSCWYRLSAGLHNFELWYFEWEGKASVKFSLSDLHEWQTQLIWKTLKNLTDKIGALSLAQDSIKRQVRNLTSTASTLNEQAITLQGEVRAIDNEIIELQNEVQSISNTVSITKAAVTKLSGLSGQVDTIVHQQAMLLQEVQTMKKKLATMSTIVTSVSGEVTTMSSQVKTLKTQQTNMSGQIASLEDNAASSDSWEVHWYTMTEPGVFGKEIGTSSLPLNFSSNWGYGRIYKLWNHVGLKAYATIYIPMDSFCYFSVSASNCFILYLDGKKILDHWQVSKPFTPAAMSGKYVLSAGWHKLELHYYSWEGEAWLSFHSW